MNFYIQIVKFFLVLFLIYTAGYIVHWILATSASLTRLSEYQAHKDLIKIVFPDSVARQKTVTAIVPAYNEEVCITDTVDSLLLEDYPGLQIFVVDDGSADGTAKRMLETYDLQPFTPDTPQDLPSKPVKQCYRREIRGISVTLICKENGGKADALNCGLGFCRSPYCLVVDADTQVTPGSVRIMVSQFLTKPDTVVCAGSVRNSLYGTPKYRSLHLFQRLLVLFQMLEYYRTFYVQRILFDKFNANVIVSGAFAMFDCSLVKAVGGYKTHTIGEDMELTMRLHAYCRSQGRPYKIANAPEACCGTQVPYRYRDFYSQRRRWHIGMIQSLGQHAYMLGRHYYGWVGILGGSFMIIYEFMSPVVEILGVVTLISVYLLQIMNPLFMLKSMLLYSGMILLSQMVLLLSLRVYGVEPLSVGTFLRLFAICLLEFFLFHPMNMLIKLSVSVTYRKNTGNWGKIQRTSQKVSS